MASPTTPTHGKFGAMYRLRPNGFKGSGLADATWGLSYSGGASAYYEVEIQTAAAPDKFQWKKNGGAYTQNVSITGAAQTLDSTQTITFVATTGHTVGDRWAIGNLAAEATTESTVFAQITDAMKRVLNPGAPPVWTDSGGKNRLITDFTRGLATFDGNTTIVTVAGNNGYIPELALEKAGYLIDWSLNITLDMGEASRMGQQWKEAVPGMAGGEGNANTYFLGEKSFLAELGGAAAGTQKYVLLELFNYDPDQDQTGDHLLAWAIISGISPAAAVGEVVKEPITFRLVGIPSFVENV